MTSSERNYVGNITTASTTDALVFLEIADCGATLLTMEQADSLASILRGYVEQYRQAERAEDTARRRRQGAKDGWEIRRGKQPTRHDDESEPTP